MRFLIRKLEKEGYNTTKALVQRSEGTSNKDKLKALAEFVTPPMDNWDHS